MVPFLGEHLRPEGIPVIPHYHRADHIEVNGMPQSCTQGSTFRVQRKL